MPLRKPTDEELNFLAYMIREGKGRLRADWQKTLMVAPMDNGGMGSLILYPEGKIITGKIYGTTLYEVEFRDADRVPVVASLNLDQHGDLFELDIWKLTFDPLIRLPDIENQ